MQKFFNIMLATAMMLFIISCSDDSNPVEPEKKPTISSISSDSVQIGELIIIYGTNFGTVRDSSIVSFGGAIAIDYTSWSDTLIKVKIPEGAKSGFLWAVVNGKKSNEVQIIIKIKTAPTIEKVLIPAGTFQMGSTGAYLGSSDEFPVHTVTISRAFYMSKYEVTQKQYQAVMGNNPSYFAGETLPVERVTWYNAVAFCNVLSQLEGKTPCYTVNGTNVTCNWDANGYRLPTEAEWEYAAKAGTTTDFYNGSLTNPSCTPIDANLDNIAWYCGNSNETTHPVGQKQPNAFGLYDMTGNVWEWCWDWWSNSYSSTTVIDPTGASTGSYRVYRGGSWYGNADQCRSTYREYRTPSFNYDYIGFRIVRVGNQCQSGFDCYLKENLPTD